MTGARVFSPSHHSEARVGRHVRVWCGHRDAPTVGCMAWDFETEPEFQAKLDWMESFVRDEIIPRETLAEGWRSPDGRATRRKITDPRHRIHRRVLLRPHKTAMDGQSAL